MLGTIALADGGDVPALIEGLEGIEGTKSLADVYNVPITERAGYESAPDASADD
jgi:hypothetical protein